MNICLLPYGVGTLWRGSRRWVGNLLKMYSNNHFDTCTDNDGSLALDLKCVNYNIILKNTTYMCVTCVHTCAHV